MAEFAEQIRIRGEARADFAETATLTTFGGSVLSGRGDIDAYLDAPDTADVSGFMFFADQILRCGPGEGIEFGEFRARRAGGPPVRLVGGRWYARWSRAGDGTWEITEALMQRPGTELPAPGPDCASTSDESAARARATLSAHGPPFHLSTVDPHADLQRAGRYPFRSTAAQRKGLMVSASYRVTSWAAVGAVWNLEPRIQTAYSVPGGPTELLYSSGNFLAVTAGYQGRNVGLEAGPALLRSTWEWDEGGIPSKGVHNSAVGFVAGGRVTVPLQSDLAIELLVQRRFFGDEAVPRTEPLRTGTWSGFYVAVGLAVRRTER